MKNFKYKVINGNELAIIDYTGTDAVAVIPSEIDGKPVTSIGSWAFNDCTSLICIEIPNSVTIIGEGAFSYCSSLTSVIMPNNVTSIGGHAFFRCTGLTNVGIPNSVVSIKEKAFGYRYDNYYNYKKINGFTIKGIKGSEAEKYANDNGFKFNAISK